VSLSLFFKSVVFYFAAALIVYAVSPYDGLDVLLKLMAFALGASLLTPMIYPHVRGVRKGDEVQVELARGRSMPGLLKFFFQAGGGVAMENGRVGGKIMVMMNDNSIRRCVIKSYAGFFKPAQVKLIEKEELDTASITVV
jgi:hypothetical protein